MKLSYRLSHSALPASADAEALLLVTISAPVGKIERRPVNLGVALDRASTKTYSGNLFETSIVSNAATTVMPVRLAANAVMLTVVSGISYENLGGNFRESLRPQEGTPMIVEHKNAPGKGLSSALVNISWGAFNIVISYVLVLRVGTFDLRDTLDAVAFGVGFFLIGALSGSFVRAVSWRRHEAARMSSHEAIETAVATTARLMFAPKRRRHAIRPCSAIARRRTLVGGAQRLLRIRIRRMYSYEGLS